MDRGGAKRGRRYRVRDYPRKGDGRDVGKEEVIGDEEEEEEVLDPKTGEPRCRVAWEVGGLPGIGAYSIDSWRIFCRDKLRRVDNLGELEPYKPHLSTSAEENQENANEDKIEIEEPRGEWTRVLPQDKELRAYLRWRWLRCGWEWDPETGERRRAGREVLERGRGGGVIVEGGNGGGGGKMEIRGKGGG